MTHTYKSPLSMDDFNALLDCHGADLSRWPLDAVKPALALIEQDATAKALFDGAGRMDDLLRRADAEVDLRIAARHGQTAPELQARILAAINNASDMPAVAPVVAAQAVKASRGALLSLRSLFAPGGSLLMIGIVGFMMGFMDPANAQQETLLDGLVHGQEMVISGDADTTTMGEW